MWTIYLCGRMLEQKHVVESRLTSILRWEKPQLKCFAWKKWIYSIFRSDAAKAFSSFCFELCSILLMVSVCFGGHFEFHATHTTALSPEGRCWAAGSWPPHSPGLNPRMVLGWFLLNVSFWYNQTSQSSQRSCLQNDYYFRFVLLNNCAITIKAGCYGYPKLLQ